MLVGAIRYAVMIAVALDPAAAVQAPGAVGRLPGCGMESVARARALPMPLGPDVFAAIPIPETRRPFIPAARGRNEFMTGCGRRNSNGKFAIMSKRLDRCENSSGNQDCRSGTDNFFHGSHSGQLFKGIRTMPDDALSRHLLAEPTITFCMRQLRSVARIAINKFANKIFDARFVSINLTTFIYVKISEIKSYIYQ